MRIITTGANARKKIKTGIDLVADQVKLTLGPSGRNAVIGKKFETPRITNDGISVANSIEHEDETIQIGIDLAKEVGTLTDNKAKDGTTTAITLLQAINDAAFEKLNSNQKTAVTFSATIQEIDPISIKREIDVACKDVVTELNAMARQISTKEDMEKVAFVSVEDRKIAQDLSEIFDKVGKDGVVRVEDGADEITYDIVSGMEINSGYSSSLMVNAKDRELVLDNVKILATNYNFNDLQSFKDLVIKLQNDKVFNIVIIGEDFSRDILIAAEQTKLQTGRIVYCLKPPFWTNKDRMEDIAVRFNAHFYDKDSGIIQEITSTTLGDIEKVVATKDKTLFIGGKGDTTLRVEDIKTEIKNTKGAVDKLKLEERIANLTGGIAVIRVGANSDAERGYWKDKIVDAVGAVKGALQEGVVAGGGIALFNIAIKMDKNILTEALKTPFAQIQKNAGGSLEIGEDIIDSVRTTRTALQGACSLAGSVVTIETASAIKKEKPQDESLTIQD